MSPAARLLGTVEWINWSRFDVIPVVLGAPFGPLGAGATVANLDFQWRDGWYFALGGEYDWSRDLTLRVGTAYEISPVDGPTTRPSGVPDSNRWYASMGGSYRWSESISVDFSYHHVFYENDAPFDRVPDAVLVPQQHFFFGDGGCQRRCSWDRGEDANGWPVIIHCTEMMLGPNAAHGRRAPCGYVHQTEQREPQDEL